CRWIVSIEVQHSTQRTNLNRRFFGFVSEALVAVPNDRSLSAPRVDGDERYLISRAFDDLREIDVDAVVFQRFETKHAFLIRAKTSGVSSLQTQPAQCDHRGRGLPAGRLRVFEKT